MPEPIVPPPVTEPTTQPVNPFESEIRNLDEQLKTATERHTQAATAHYNIELQYAQASKDVAYAGLYAANIFYGTEVNEPIQNAWQLNREIKPLKDESDRLNTLELQALTDLRRLEWKKEIYSFYAPLIYNGQLSLQDAKTSLMRTPGFVMSSDDISFINEFISSPVIQKFSSVATTPAGVSQRAVVESLLATAKGGAPMDVASFTVAEILKSFTTPVPGAKLPDGLSPKEALDILGVPMGVNDIEELYKKNLEELNRYSLEKQKAYNDYTDMVKNHVSTTLTFKQTLVEGLTQPMLLVADTAERYLRNVGRPFAGITVKRILYAVPGVQPVEVSLNNEYTAARAAGANPYMSYGVALRKCDLPWYSKLVSEVVFDPLNVVGWAQFSKVARLVPVAGRFVAAANDGLIEGTNIAFSWASDVWKALPRTAGQDALQASNKALEALRISVARNTGLPFTHQWTPDMIREAATVARNGIRAVGSPGAEFGSFQLIGKHVELDDMADLLVKLGVDKTGITTEQLLDINKMFANLKLPGGTITHIQTGLLTSDEMVTEMLRTIGKSDATVEQRTLISTFFNNIDDAARRYADEVIFAPRSSSYTMMRRYQDHVAEMVLAQRKSPLYLREYQHGLMNAFFTGLDYLSRFPVFIQLDRLLVTPMARQYLLFFNYGPMNIAETLFRGMAGGVDMFPALRMAPPISWIPGLKWNKNMPAKIGQVLYGDLNAPIDLLNAADTARGEMALIADKRAQGIERLLPPGIITRPSIKSIFGKNLEDFPLSLQELFIEAPARVQTQQRFYYFNTRFMQELQKENPELMKKIYDAGGDITKKQLQGLTKQDLQQLQEVMNAFKIRGPEAIRANIQNQAGYQLGKAATDLRKTIFRDLTTFDTASKDRVMAAVLDGTALKDPDAFIRTIGESAVEKKLVDNLMWATQMYDNLAAEMTEHVPKNSEELLAMVGLLSDARLTSNDLITDFRGLMVLRRHQLADIAAKDILDEAASKRILESMRSNNANLDNIASRVRHHLEGTQPVYNKAQFNWSKHFTEAQKDEVMEIFDKLPENVKFNVREVAVNPRLRTTHAQYNSIEHRIELNRYMLDRSLYTGTEPLPTLESAISHEVGHSVLDDMINRGDYSLFGEIIGVSPESRVTWGGQVGEEIAEFRRLNPDAAGAENAQILYSLRKKEYRALADRFADSFGAYSIGRGEVVQPQFLKALETQFPKSIGKIKIDPERAAQIRSLLDIEDSVSTATMKTRENIQNIWNTRRPTKPGGGPANDAWWTETNAQWETEWAKNRIEVRRYRQEADLIRTRLSGYSFVVPPTIEKELTPAQVAYVFRANGATLTESLFRPETQTLMTKEQFIDAVSARAGNVSGLGRTAADIGFTDEAIGKVYDRLFRNIGFDPSTVHMMTPQATQLENLRQALIKSREVYALPKNTVDELNAWMEQTAKELEIAVPDKAPFQQAKEAAMEKARKQYMLDFTDYTQNNAFDGFMKMQMPFWSYESQRFPYILRNAIQKPGLVMNLGKYMNYTESGYIHLPGTDLEINIFRGSVAMGGFRRLFLRDYPEYYESFPGAEVIDYMGRLGWYPGIHVTGPMTLFGAGPNSSIQWGELAPPWMKSVVDSYLSVLPGSKPAKVVSELLLPEKYREVLIMNELASRGYDGLSILNKKREGYELTSEEQDAWDAALGRTSKFSVMESQFAMFRFFPDEKKKAYEAAAQWNYELSGITPETQDWIRRHQGITGHDLNYYIGGLTPLQQDALNAASGIQTWSRLSTPMLPQSEQEKVTRTTEFWREVERKRNENVTKFGDLDKLLANNLSGDTPDISINQWMSQVGDLLSQSANLITELKKNPRYANIPVTYAERVAEYEKSGRQPTFHPIQELLWMYYELKPEEAINPETGVVGLDWDTYWAKTYVLLHSLDESVQAEFLSNMQRDWTPLRKLWWDTNVNYIRKYNNIRDVVMSRYNPDQQVDIKRYSVAAEEERTELESILLPNGNKLIATFNAEVTRARRNMRKLLPELDAYLLIWGKTKELLTKQAELSYQQIKQEVISAARSGR